VRRTIRRPQRFSSGLDHGTESRCWHEDKTMMSYFAGIVDFSGGTRTTL
jgi:hypothetical protein